MDENGLCAACVPKRDPGTEYRHSVTAAEVNGWCSAELGLPKGKIKGRNPVSLSATKAPLQRMWQTPKARLRGAPRSLPQILPRVQDQGGCHRFSLDLTLLSRGCRQGTKSTKPKRQKKKSREERNLHAPTPFSDQGSPSTACGDEGGDPGGQGATTPSSSSSLPIFPLSFPFPSPLFTLGTGPAPPGPASRSIRRDRPWATEGGKGARKRGRGREEAGKEKE